MRQITTDVDLRFARLGRLLVRHRDKDALMTLLPLYGTTASSSLVACCVMAAMFPEEADTVASEIAHYRPVDHLSRRGDLW